MKKIILLLALSTLCMTAQAQKSKSQDLEKRISDIEDRIAIKNVVDTFSVLADHKDITTQVLLFTENGVVESKANGRPGNVLSGRKQIGDAFSAYLALFETVYHMNGQQTITLNGDKASGISYCTVTLIGNDQTGKKMKTTMGVYYQDEFVKVDGRWLIAHRTSNFTWQERTPVSQ